MTYDKNYSGSTGSTGSTTGTAGTTGSGFGRSSGAYGSQGHGSTGYGYGSPGSSPNYGSSPYGSSYGSDNWGMTSPSAGSGKMLLGMLIGAAAGAAAALLLAPTNGREARQNLSRWARDTSSKATEMAGTLRNRFGSQSFGSGTEGGEFHAGGTSSPVNPNEDRNIPEL